MAEKSEKDKPGSALYIAVAGGVAACLAVIYLVVGLGYRNRFFPNVTINGMDVSGKTAEQVKTDLSHISQDYALHIQERDDREEVLYGKDFGLQFYYEDALPELLESQRFWTWGIQLLTHTEHELPVTAEYDREALKRLIQGLSCVDAAKMVRPEDAYLAFDAAEGLHIVPEKKGSLIRAGDLGRQITAAVENAVTDISLEELGLYVEPGIVGTDPELNEKCSLWKPYLDTRITYHFDDATEILDGSVFYEWMSEEHQEITFDRDQIREYVRGMARKYNTAYSSKELETSYGETVMVPAGPYGWLIDQAQETDALEAALLACESQDREPVYALTAASHTQPDYGDTYVEVNLAAQHLFFYKNGELIVESDFVSGNESRGWATPAGAFPLTYKERNATLRGANYATPVSYWMPFNGNIGLHDSPWRKSFGKNIYKKNGSHGCINLPPDVARTIYEDIEKGMPVLCYYLSGTEWTGTEPEPEPAAEQEPEIEPEPGIEPQPVAEPEPGIEPQPVAEPEPEIEPQPVTDPGSGDVQQSD